MPVFTTTTPRFPVNVNYPESWHFEKTPVPKLVVPRQLFAISNRPIQLTPAATSQPRPMVAPLDWGAMFVWCYFQAPGDPDPSSLDSLPDYSRYRLPLMYRESEVFASSDAREWDPRQYVWRRVGFQRGGIRVTVWIWEGTAATPADIDDAAGIVASVA